MHDDDAARAPGDGAALTPAGGSPGGRQPLGAAADRGVRALIAILRELVAPDPWSRLDRVVDQAAGALEAETGSLFLVRGRRRRYLLGAVVGGRAMARGEAPRLGPGDGVPGWVAAHDEPICLDAPHDDPRFRPDLFPPATGAGPVRNLICVPLRDEIGVSGVIEIVNRTGGFGPPQQILLTAIADEVAVALRKARLIEELQRERALEREVLDINRSLTSSLDLREVLIRIVDGVGRVVDFDAVGIFLVRDDGTIEEVVERGYDVERLHLLHQKLGEGLVGWVISTGEPLIVPDVRADRRYVDARPATRSELVAPMVSRGEVIGALNLESDRPDAYDDDHLERLLAFADQATVAVESARLHERALRARRLEEELAVARRIQLDLMPDRSPVLPGIDVAGLNVPSEQVGGDYYDFIEVAPDQLGLVIGDVSGKGVAAGIIMASFRAGLLAEIRNSYSIATILAKVNRLLCESTDLDRFVTALYGVLDLSTRRFTYASAGHLPALLVHADGSVEELGAGGPVLGAFPDVGYEEDLRVLEPGDLLILYTDGVTETVDRDGNEFGAERLIDLAVSMRELPAAASAAAIDGAVRRFAGGGAALDDLTLVVLRVTG